MLVRTMNPMKKTNYFKLGLFLINADDGTAFTKVPNRWRASWPGIEIKAPTGLRSKTAHRDPVCLDRRIK